MQAARQPAMTRPPPCKICLQVPLPHQTRSLSFSLFFRSIGKNDCTDKHDCQPESEDINWLWLPGCCLRLKILFYAILQEVYVTGQRAPPRKARMQVNHR